MVVCDCGSIFDHVGEIEWHRTTQGHVWYILKKELDCNYIYIKKMIPEDAKCDICNPKWFIVSHKNRLTVRCKKCKKDRLDLIKSQFRVKGHSKVKID